MGALSDQTAVEQAIAANGDYRAEQALRFMSPFEVKNLLVAYAKDGDKSSARTMLNAGRGNPNWTAATPRAAFFLLGSFALEEARRTIDRPDVGLAGMPPSKGCADRFQVFMQGRTTGSDAEGALFLQNALSWLTKQGFDPDDLIHEWTQGVIGCEYPMPDRILANTQRILNRYLSVAVCDGDSAHEPYDLFATEGGTAAMCYLFYSLKCNFLINPGDTMALMTPIFTPYLEIPHLNDYNLNVVNINASTTDSEGRHTWQYPDEELEKLADPSIKLLCLVNPSNPPSYAMDEASRAKLIDIVRTKNPNLLIITDDIYGTFVPHYRSIFADLPENTACVYSFSKYFGATGWRLATIACAESNKFDELIAALPAEKKAILKQRYACLTDNIEAVKFIDRMVADSRLVALNGTAGLSTPQQVQMALFAMAELMDPERTYRKAMQRLVATRYDLLWKGFGETPVPDPLRADYYSLIDLGEWAEKLYGAGFRKWLQEHYDSLDIVVRLAQDAGVVLMDGAGFDGPEWSARVSLANLNTDDYGTIGSDIARILGDYAAVWQKETAAQ